MEVWKFGGTSVGSPQRMREVAELIHSGKQRWIVLSAVSGTTNKLVAFNKAVEANDVNRGTEIIHEFNKEYDLFIKDLLPELPFQEMGSSVLKDFITLLSLTLTSPFAEPTAKLILAQGEILSTHLFHLYLQYRGFNAALLSALDFMQILPDGEPDFEWISQRLSFIMQEYSHYDLWITQGYICKNSNGEIDNLQRGGSDYTATILGAAIKAEEIIIWTDIDGMHNNDPRHVQNTYPIRKVSFREAAELAYFGAKILHPTCVIPAENAGIPIRLKNTFTPDTSGTLISGESSGHLVTAMAAKDNITAIRIRSGRMLNAFGFLRRVFEVFEKHPFQLIKLNKISAYRINWQDKATNIQEIAEELNIGLDSIVFIDDNPVERERVSQMLPQVTVPDFPESPYLMVKFFKNIYDQYFQAYKLTNEDLIFDDFSRYNSSN
jgi:aspartate kinase